MAKRTEESKEVLASAQQKNEELKAQEEELRQNMEELSAQQRNEQGLEWPQLERYIIHWR